MSINLCFPLLYFTKWFYQSTLLCCPPRSGPTVLLKPMSRNATWATKRSTTNCCRKSRSQLTQSLARRLPAGLDATQIAHKFHGKPAPVTKGMGEKNFCIPAWKKGFRGRLQVCVNEAEFIHGVQKPVHAREMVKFSAKLSPFWK